MFPKQANPSSKQARSRLLNVIFFTDASKTRTLVMPVKRAMLYLALAAGVLTWSIVSAVLVFKYRYDNAALRAKLQTSLATLFDYQTRFDDVFEVAYPESTDKEAIVARKPEATKPTKGAVEAKVAGDEEARVEDVKQLDAKALAAVEAVSWKLVSGKLDVQFTLKNTEPNTQSNGTVSGVATFVASDGVLTYIAAPNAVSVDSQGNITQPQRGHLYSIRFHKRRSLVFAPPANTSGHFTNVKIQLHSAKGETVSHPFDMKVAVQPPRSVQSAPAVDKSPVSESSVDGAGVLPPIDTTDGP